MRLPPIIYMCAATLLALPALPACQTGDAARAALDIDSGSGQAGCPASPGAGDCTTEGLSCTYGGENDGGPIAVCTCTATGWRCNDCPADFQSPEATCTPGQSCNYEDWEHGCSCACNDAGRWACTPDTIGSTCPTGTPDAGP